MDAPTTRTSKTKVTATLVRRVAERMKDGIAVKVAIYGEGTTLAAYEQFLRDHPRLAMLHDTGKRQFMERAVKAMLEDEKPASNFRWLLEHCHPDLLAQPGEAVSTAPLQTIGGLPEEILQRAREYARNAGQY